MSAVRIMVAVLMLQWCLGALAAEPGRLRFDLGVSAYRDGQLHAALDHFQAARAAGYDAPRLQFNLALTHYRLRQYDRAETEFEGLLDEADFEAIAAYHLGLIAERRGQTSAARARYAQAHSKAEQATTLQRQARAGLERTRAVRDTRIYLFGGGGFDSNPALVDDPSLVGSDDDVFVETFGDLAHRRGAGLFEAGFFLRRHASENEFDTALLRGAAGRESALRDGVLRYRGDIALVRIDGDRLQEEYSALFDWRRSLGEGRQFDAQMHVARIEAADRFGFLTGWRHRGGLRLAGMWRGTWLRLGYQLELNDRADLQREDAFFSQSPMRNRLRLDAWRRLHPAVSIEGRVEYRHSRFADNNRFQDGEIPVEARRVERRSAVRGGVRWHIDPRWNLLGELEYTRNAASIDSFRYNRTVALIGLEWTP